MNSVETYTLAYWGVIVILATVVVQWFIASGTKASQPRAIPGKIPETLGHDSFVFRAHRTFMNSLENVPVMLGVVFLSFFIEAGSNWVTVLVWVFALARIGHMVLYYSIATEKNPSPRSYFFLLGVAANAGLLVFCAISLL